MANLTTQFGGFLTNVGIAQQANTAVLGLPWNITHMLIGDAGGEPSQTPDPTPKPTQTALLRQVYRAQLNALYQSPADPGVLVAELVLPPETGGWWIRELALEDANGNFIAVAKPAPSYKPLLAQGSGRTQTIRMHVVFGNLANVTLKVDPSIVLATRDYVDKAREAAELYARNQIKAHVEEPDPHPQYLRRADVAKDAGPLAWLGAAGGTADALVLSLKSNEAALGAYAAGQRFQFQATATNTGAATAKIGGLAAVAVKKTGAAGLVDLVGGDIRAGALYDLNYDGAYFQLGGGVGAGKAFERFSFEASAGQLVFNVPHVVGSTLVMRNGREVTGYLSDGQKITLKAPCNLGESVEVLAFSSFSTANTYTKAEVQALLTTASALPVGSMLPFPKGTVPHGFLEVDGSVQTAAVYPDLAAYLAGSFNKGDEPAGYFRLPESRGEFLRGWDHGRGVDDGRVIGSWQADELKSHAHLLGVPVSASIASGANVVGTAAQNTLPSTLTGGGETRPRNLAVMWCIKAWNAPVNQGSIDIAALAAQVQEISDKGTIVGSTRNGKVFIGVPSLSATYVADELVLVSALGGKSYRVSNFNKSLNLAMVGVGGMDAGAAPANGFVAIYAIYNPTTAASALLGVNATSARAPEVYGGVNMPVGYTASCLLTVVPIVSSKFSPCAVRGREVHVGSFYVYITNTIVTNILVSAATLVPFNAVSMLGTMEATCTAAAQLAILLTDGYLPGLAGLKIMTAGVVAAGTVTCPFGGLLLTDSREFAISTSFSGTGGTPTYKIAVSGYVI
ncbi:phage tail protein [Pseudomonas sp. RIT623]|uniref:phage tail-collar fiber domain-containing protein n=1 Tax=Pseudomonas sp. RIT623 TaxID=2559075 RepID=UPI002114258B|nr:phage tail protein [Pseudomonas sp. RIT623]